MLSEQQRFSYEQMINHLGEILVQTEMLKKTLITSMNDNSPQVTHDMIDNYIELLDEFEIAAEVMEDMNDDAELSMENLD